MGRLIVADQGFRQPPPSNLVQRAGRSPLAWLILLTTLAAGLFLDFGSKSWAFREVASTPVVLDRALLLSNPAHNPIPPHQGMRPLPWNLIEFQLVYNRGAVFGLGDDKRFFFIAFTIAALFAALIVFARATLTRHRLAHVAIGLVLAGGIGNLHDRIAFGVVRDFLHLMPEANLPKGWTWPGGSTDLFPWVFNFADVMLLLGMGLLIVHMNRVERQRVCVRQAQAMAVPVEADVHG